MTCTFCWPRGVFFNFDHITQPWFLSPVSLGKYPKVWTIKFSIDSLVWQVWWSWHVNALMWHESRIVCQGPNAIHSFNAHPVNIYYVLDRHNKRTHSYHTAASSTFSCFWAEKIAGLGSFFQEWNLAKVPQLCVFERVFSSLIDTRGRSIASNRFGQLDIKHCFKTGFTLFSKNTVAPLHPPPSEVPKEETL